VEESGKREQFRFNHSVEARFDSAIFATEKKKLDKAKKELEEGKKLLSERQKLIKLADRSECGWTTVSDYVTDDLEDTPEDKRRFSKAENSANKALDSKREKSRFREAAFRLSSGEEPASLMDRKDTGETAAPISFLQEDQKSQPLGSLREHVDFWSNSIPASDFIINTIVEG
ncbi:unnamed protein product, partial [Porites lobata]